MEVLHAGINLQYLTKKKYTMEKNQLKTEVFSEEEERYNYTILNGLHVQVTGKKIKYIVNPSTTKSTFFITETFFDNFNHHSYM